MGSRVYKILYVNDNGSDFHDIEHDEHPDDFVTSLRTELGDDPDEVKAFLVGVHPNISWPWFVEEIEVI